MLLRPLLVTLAKFIPKLPIDGYMLAMIGTVILAALLPASGSGAEVLAYVVHGAIALLFFVYGARLAPGAILAGIMHWRLQGSVLASTFVLFPIVGFLLTTLFRPLLGNELAFGLMFIALLPSTVQSSIAFTSIGRGNVPAALCSASISNLLGIVITPLLVTFFLTSQGGGISLLAVRDISLQLLAPFVVGQFMRPLIGRWINNHKTFTSLVDRGSILLIVYSAFSEGMVAGVWSQVSPESLVVVVGLDIVMLTVILVLTTYGSRWLGFSKEDEITIVFCGSKKSMASGIPMANILFAGQAIGLIVVPLMIFHQIQLMVCAALARRYARRPELEIGTIMAEAEDR